MSYWDKTDWTYLLAFFAAISLLGILGANNTISREVSLVGFIILMILALGNPLLKGHIMRTYTKTLSKSIDDYWAEIKQQTQETGRKQKFHYELNLPETYMPQHQVELPEAKLSLHEINRRELSLGFGEKYDQANGTRRPEYQTIIYHTQRQKIIDILPKDISGTMAWLKENKEMFQAPGKLGIFPKSMKETIWGTGTIEGR